MRMTHRDDDILPAADVTSEVDPSDATDAAARTRPGPPAARGTGPALLLSILALAGAGVALWQSHLATRGDDNAQADLAQRVDALDARANENERRGARNNELARTLRDQLAESEQLRQRLQEDLLALADRSARAEALIHDLTRDRSRPQQSGADDARHLLIQAESRLLLSGDIQGARLALDLAAQSLAGQALYADLRVATLQAREQIDSLARPTGLALLAQLDALLDGLAGASTETRPQPMLRTDSNRGWWGRQFDRIDHLISIRRDDEVAAVGPRDRDGARAALQRARLAALDHDNEGLHAHLTAARAALAACCQGTATQALLDQLDRLLAIDWRAPLPDLAGLRQRLDERRAIQPDTPAPAPSTGAADTIEQESST